MRKYKCCACDRIVDHIAMSYDTGFEGGDELMCPACGAIEPGFSDVELEDTTDA